jgi:two-component system, LuxR family, sensor kinase FixL
MAPAASPRCLLSHKRSLMHGSNRDVVVPHSIEQELRQSNATLEDQVRQRTASIEMLHDIATHVHEACCIEEALVFVLKRVSECNGWSYAHAYLVAPEDPDQLVPLKGHYEAASGDYSAFRRHARQTPLSRGSGLPGRALASGEPVWAQTPPDDVRADRNGVLRGLPIAAAAAFPVSVDGCVEVVLEFFSSEPLDDNSRTDQVMTSVGEHLARTIERLRADTVVRESEQRLRELAESIAQVFWVFDPAADRMLYVSPGWQKIVNAPAAQGRIETIPWRSYIHPHDRQRVLDEISPGQLTQRADVTYRVVRTDGEVRWMHDVALPLHDESGSVRRILGVAEDVTERRALEREIADAATHEQQRLSRDLHDSIGQELTGLTMMAAKLVRALEQHSPEDAQAAAGLVTGLKRTLQQVRRISRGLAPVDIEAGGLTVALAQLAEQTRLMATAECIFRCESPVVLRDPGVANHLYRIAQEAIANSLKHAHATTIRITLDTDGRFCRLTVEDDGHGIGATQNGSGDGTGLRIMRYRANLIGADFGVEPRTGGGTRVCCRLRVDGQFGHSP